MVLQRQAIEKFILELHLHVILYFPPATVQDNARQYDYMTAETMCLSPLAAWIINTLYTK